MVVIPRKDSQIAKVILSLEDMHAQRPAKSVTAPAGVHNLFGQSKLQMFARKLSPVLKGLATGVMAMLAGGVVTAWAQHLTPTATSSAVMGLFAATTVLFAASSTLLSLVGSKKPAPKPAHDKAFRTARRETRRFANAVNFAYEPIICAR